MSGRRRRSRELALQLLYQRDIAGTEPEEMFVSTDEYANSAPEVQEYALINFGVEFKPDMHLKEMKRLAVEERTKIIFANG